MLKRQDLRRAIVWAGLLLMIFGSQLGIAHAQMGSPPILSELRVEPLILEEGDGLKVVNVFVQVFDEDEDLKKVKVIVRFPDGSKEKINLVDDGSGADAVAADGRFSGQVPLDTDQAQLISFQVKAKDLEKNQAVIGAIVSVVDTGVAPILSDVLVEPAVLLLGSGPQTVTVSVRVTDPNDDLKNVKLDRLVKAGTAKRAAKLGKLVDDGTGGDLEADDGIFTIEIQLDPTAEGRIPLRLEAKDLAKHKMRREFSVDVQTEQVSALTVNKDGDGNGTVMSSPEGLLCESECVSDSADFPRGTDVILSATPGEDSVFEGWSGGGCLGVEDCVVTLTEDLTVTARFKSDVGDVPLTVNKAGDGMGIVIASPTGITCELECISDSAGFPRGTDVVLSATPDEDSIFAGWSGGGCLGVEDCVVTLAGALTVIAHFNADDSAIPLTLNIAGEGSGTVTSEPEGIDCLPDCLVPFAPGTVVTLSAAPSEDSTFVGWNGGGCLGTDTCDVTMAADLTITATFVNDASSDGPLTVNVVGDGVGNVTSSPAGIDCLPDCDGVFPLGTVVTLIALEEIGSSFSGWSGGGCMGTGMCELTLTSDLTVTATFDAVPVPVRTLDVQTIGEGSGQVNSAPGDIACGMDCDEEYQAGTVVTLTAVVDSGTTFAGWSGGGCVGTGICTVTLTNNLTVTATFDLVPIPRTLMLETAGSGSGQVNSAPEGIDCGADCDEEYLPGTVVTLTAMPDAGSTFVGWSGGECAGTGTCAVTLSDNLTVIATFDVVPLPRTLTVGKTGSGSGRVTSVPAGIDCGTDCDEEYQAGTVVTLTAIADSGATFAGWSGGDCAGQGNCAITMSADKNVTASFKISIPASLYVANRLSNSVSVINLETNSVTRTISVGVGPGGVAFHPNGTFVYVVNRDTDSVSVIDTASMMVTNTIFVGDFPHFVAFTPDGEFAYVTNRTEDPGNVNTVSVINTTTHAEQQRFDVGSLPVGVAAHPSNGSIYVANAGSNTVTGLGGPSNPVSVTVSVGNGPLGLAVTPNGAAVYVANRLSNTVSVVSTATNSVMGDPINVGNGPSFVAVHPNGSRVYVTNNDSGTVSVIDTESNDVIATVPVGSMPRGIVVHPNGKRVYVANRDSGTVSVIATETNTVVSTITVGVWPIGIAFGPAQ